MPRSDWLLLLLTKSALGVDGPEGLDPVRIQKGMFLTSMRGPAKGLYAFRPYNWGPFSPAVYGDLDRLVDEGLVLREDVAGRDWQRYSPSPAGVEAAREFAESQKPVSVQWMGSCRRFLTERSFTQLLRDVYAAYPEYATASQFSG